MHKCTYTCIITYWIYTQHNNVCVCVYNNLIYIYHHVIICQSSHYNVGPFTTFCLIISLIRHHSSFSLHCRSSFVHNHHSFLLFSSFSFPLNPGVASSGNSDPFTGCKPKLFAKTPQPDKTISGWV